MFRNEWATWRGGLAAKFKSILNILRSLKKIFLLEMKNIATIGEIPDELILNFDLTALNYVPVTPWTMEEEGA